MAFINQPGEALQEIAAAREVKQTEKVDLESEITLIQKSIDNKDVERHSILDLFRKSIITFTDLEKQNQKSIKRKISSMQVDRYYSTKVMKQTR